MKTICGWLLILLLIFGSSEGRAQTNMASTSVDPNERHFDLITVGALAFTNVWVHRQTNYHILIRHDGGIYTIKLTDLPTAELQELKSQIGHLASVEPATEQPKSDSWVEKLKTKFRAASLRTKVIGGAGSLLLIALIILVLRKNDSSAAA